MSNKSSVKILAYTWPKDSHGLFDYESGHLFTNKFKISGQGHFFRNSNEICMMERDSLNDLTEEVKVSHLFDVKQDEFNQDRYFLCTDNQAGANTNLGIVVRGIKKEGQPQGYELKVGDHVKIGRVNFLVREIKDAQGHVTKLKTVQEINYYSPSEENNEKNRNGVTCKICLSEDFQQDSIDDMLVSPCKCRGSCEYVHLKCLKQWIDSKKSRIENSSNICLAFNYKKLSCEICKDNLPYSVKLGEREVEIVDIKKPESTPYILIEKIENLKENRGLYLVKAAEEPVQIGRGHTNHILVSDISVSRNHASISYKNGKFMLFDNNSKFGTLVQINQPIELTNEKTIIQCGKTVIIVSIKRENIISLPKVIETLEVLESPKTPSTINDPEGEQKQNVMENKQAKRRGRPKKGERQIIHKQSELDTTSLYQDSLEFQGLENNLVPQSKKIFKIIKKDVSSSQNNNGRRRGTRSN